MNPQFQPLIVPLASIIGALITVLASLASTYWSKKMDVRQKKEDRNQELRKLYVARKIEAGEAAIGRWTLIANKLDWFDHQFLIEDFDNPLHEDAVREQVNHESKINELLRSSHYTDKNYHYLYFDDEPSDAELEAKHRSLQRDLRQILAERSEIMHMLQQGPPGGIASGLEQSLEKRRTAYQVTLPQYLAVNRELKQFILRACADLRYKLATQYDLIDNSL